ncbi:O-acyltransferase WSD1 [Trifolium repens]|nr:O-acyltransferase WSD1 [Trifolium repens]
MDNIEEEIREPVSPSGQYFNTAPLCSYVFGFLELEIPIDDSQVMYLLQHVFLPINPRFSSIMVRDEDGIMKWKKVESKLGVTINDVITGVIFYGIRLYMQEIDNKARTSNSTGLVLLSTRNIGSYQSVQDMMKADSKSPWGNHISFLHLSIPNLSQTSLSNPLEFIWKAQKVIKRKRNTFTVYLIEWLLDVMLKLRGHEAVAKHIYGTLRNSSVVMSNLIGPVEPMALANHPVKGLYFIMSGAPESIDIAVMSYTRTLRITLKTQKDLIDEHKFKSCMVRAFEAISKASMEIPNKTKIK